MVYSRSMKSVPGTMRDDVHCTLPMRGREGLAPPPGAAAASIARITPAGSEPAVIEVGMGSFGPTTPAIGRTRFTAEQPGLLVLAVLAVGPEQLTNRQTTNENAHGRQES